MPTKQIEKSKRALELVLSRTKDGRAFYVRWRMLKPMTSEELFNAHGWSITMESAPLPDGRVKKAVRVHRSDSVHVLAFAEPGKILILREFRPFYRDWLWMLPSGRADKEHDLLVAAQRELQEESGYEAGALAFYCSTRHSESLDSANHIFIATDLRQNPLPQDADELIEVHALPLEEALEKVLGSPVVHTASAYALLRYLRERES